MGGAVLIPFDPDVRWSGVPLFEGLALLRELGVRLCWPSRNEFLLGGISECFPGLCLHSSLSDVDHDLTPREPSVSIACAFKPSPEVTSWARRIKATLALPTERLYAQLSDKLELLEIAQGSGVEVPRTAIVQRPTAQILAELHDSYGGMCVVQRRVDGLTGGGTALAGSYYELVDAVHRWHGEILKITPYIEGLPCTVSGNIWP